MIEVWKYMHGLYDIDRPCFTAVTNPDHHTRGNSLKLPKKRHERLALRSNSFSHRVVNLWNSLPDAVVLAPTMNSFKNRLDDYWEGLSTLYDPEYLQ